MLDYSVYDGMPFIRTLRHDIVFADDLQVTMRGKILHHTDISLGVIIDCVPYEGAVVVSHLFGALVIDGLNKKEAEQLARDIMDYVDNSGNEEDIDDDETQDDLYY
jgi:hypothetical protein